MVEKIQIFAPTTLSAASGTGKTASEKNDVFSGLSLDQLGLSKDAQNKVMWAKTQFEINYQALRSINSAHGVETSQETFSFKASYEFLQNASGADTTANPSESSETAENTETSESEQDMLTRLQDYFSPENTAQRILDVATSFFAISETAQKDGDNETSRKKFADFIGGAINTGFSQAREILGELPEDIETGIEKTHSIVFAGLDEFVKNGVDPEKSTAGGVFDKIAAYRLETSSKFASRVKSSSAASYNASGEEQDTPATTSTISTVA